MKSYLMKVEVQLVYRIRIFLSFLSMSLVNSVIFYKHLSHTNMSALEYMLSVGTTLIGNYRSRKRIGRSLAMSNRKKLRIKMSISDLQSSDAWRLSAHMPEVAPTKSRCACCSTKEKERRTI